MYEDLTKRQKEVYTLMRAYVFQKGYQPSVREIGAKLGISSTNGVAEHLQRLERKGYIKRTGKFRAVEFLK